jgi:hypothetical protein
LNTQTPGKSTLIIFLCLIVILSVGYALTVPSQTISSSGIIVSTNISLWKDANCTQNLTAILWGTLTPNQTTSCACYIRNEGATNAKLNMTSSSWNPSNTSSYMSFSWNREAYVLLPSSSVQAIFTLNIFSNITGITSFSFNIVVTGS